ncbi:MAG TPA: thioesterase family protein [Nitrososphaeraceae archaeon]|nr:thioesterase family protein [Nitrososphaeraceae archaeon]
MKFDVKIGTTKIRDVKTSSNQTTSFLWEGENVLSTPSLISEMEETCRLLLKDFVLKEKEWDSVGTIVDIKHIATTPVGSTIRLKSIIESVDNRRVMFIVEAFDNIEKIGEGKHERFIINVPNFRSKFEEKKRKLDVNK